MAEETIVTPEAEKIAPAEGSVQAEIAKTQGEPDVETKPETVPLSVFLALKDDVKELKKELKDAKTSDKSSATLEGFEEIAEKYPDVDKNFIKDMLGIVTSKAQKEIDEKYQPIIKDAEAKKAKEAFDTAFDKVYDKALKDNPDLPANIKKEMVKNLALTPAYRNTPVADILNELYGGVDTGKPSSEDEIRAAGDADEEVIDFEKITDAQKDKVLSNPKLRKEYFKFLDTK